MTCTKYPWPNPGPSTNTTFNLSNVEMWELKKVLTDIDCGKSSNVQQLSARILKDAFQALPNVLLHIMNLSIATAVFPSDWKLATIIPLEKTNNAALTTDLRPVSLLSLPGKILGPILFLVYVSDLTASMNNSNSKQYADDTVLYLAKANNRDTCMLLNEDLHLLNTWCTQNKMHINYKKTKFMCFGFNAALSNTGPLDINVAGHAFERVNNTSI